MRTRTECRLCCVVVSLWTDWRRWQHCRTCSQVGLVSLPGNDWDRHARTCDTLLDSGCCLPTSPHSSAHQQSLRARSSTVQLPTGTLRTPTPAPVQSTSALLSSRTSTNISNSSFTVINTKLSDYSEPEMAKSNTTRTSNWFSRSTVVISLVYRKYMLCLHFVFVFVLCRRSFSYCCICHPEQFAYRFCCATVNRPLPNA